MMPDVREALSQSLGTVGLVAVVFTTVAAFVLALWPSPDCLFCGDANPNKAQSDTRAIYRAAIQYQKVSGRIPTIEDLTTPDEDGRAYLESLSDDPWGQPYVIEDLGHSNFHVLSYGEDLAQGTEDDIVYPDPENDDD